MSPSVLVTIVAFSLKAHQSVFSSQTRPLPLFEKPIDLRMLHLSRYSFLRRCACPARVSLLLRGRVLIASIVHPRSATRFRTLRRRSRDSQHLHSQRDPVLSPYPPSLAHPHTDADRPVLSPALVLPRRFPLAPSSSPPHLPPRNASDLPSPIHPLHLHNPLRTRPASRPASLSLDGRNHSISPRSTSPSPPSTIPSSLRRTRILRQTRSTSPPSLSLLPDPLCPSALLASARTTQARLKRR